MALYQWSTTPATNATAGSINWAEGQAPSTVNDSARQLMADVATYMVDPQFYNFGDTPTYVSATQFTVPGNQTAHYAVNRRIKATVTAGTIYGSISVSAYTTLTTVTVVWDSGSLDAGLSAVYLAIVTDKVQSAVSATTATTATTATNIAGGASGSLPYQTGSGTTGMLAKGTNGQVLTLAAGVPSWVTAASITAATAQASTSGTAIDFTGIPSTVQRITVMLYGVSTNGTNNLLIRIGDAGGFVVSGYVSSSGILDASPTYGVQVDTTGLVIGPTAAAYLLSGAITLTKITGNTWVSSGNIVVNGSSRVFMTSGVGSTSTALTQVRVTTVGGTDAFDAGSINILYE